MPDLDQRVVVGLQELAGRAPVDADVWPATERYVTKRRRQRRALVTAVVATSVVAGVSLTVAVVHGGNSKVVVSGPSDSTATTAPAPIASALPAAGPIDGSFTITAQPANALTFAPSTLTVTAGLYGVTLIDGSVTTHTLYFDDPSTLWSPLMVSDKGETQTSRIFFGQPGTYTFYCALPGHRAAGMEGVITVTGPAVTLAQAVAAAGATTPTTAGAAA